MVVELNKFNNIKSSTRNVCYTVTIPLEKKSDNNNVV